jgi:hypothetical protein
MRSRVLVLALSVLILGGSVVGAIAATSGGAPSNAASAQYGDTCPDGSPKPPGGDCRKTPGSQKEHKKKCDRLHARDQRAERRMKARHRRSLGHQQGSKRRRVARAYRHDEQAQHRRHVTIERKCRRG